MLSKRILMLVSLLLISSLLVGCLLTTPTEVSVTGVILDQETLALVAGGATGTLVETVAPADATDPRVTWASSAEAVATVALGVVTPLTAGTAVITVTTVDGGFTDTCIVTVSAAPAEPVAVTGVTLDEATLALTVGDAAVTLVATVAPATATDTSVIWASSEETVAIVALGVVTPLNAGISAITATTVDGGFVATCVVTVTAADVPAPASTTPVIANITNVSGGDDIINLYSSDTQYMNEDEVDDGILVMGDAPKYSEVNVYVGGIVVGTSTAYGVSETFTVFVAEDDLGVDGEKTLYTTATEVGLDESDASIEYAFTLDTVAPELVSVTAEMDIEDYPEGIVAVTFSEELDADTVDEDTAADIDDWIVNSILDGDISIDNVELVSPKVVELEADFGGEDWEGNIIRVAYEDADEESPITDLAGNPAEESSEYCYLEIEEIEEEEPEPNQTPVIASILDDTVVAGATFTYEVIAIDPDAEDVLTYSLTVVPAETPAMVIDPDSGEILWNPETAGVFYVTVRVTDVGGLFATEGFILTVEAGTATKLLWVDQPAASVEDGATWDDFAIEITDEFDNRTSDTDDITITASVGLGVLTGDVVPAVDGLATFDAFTYALADPLIAETINILGSFVGLTDTPLSVDVDVTVL